MRLDIPSPAPTSVRVEGEPHHYLVRVHRLDVGDALEVFDGAGHSFAAKVEALEEGAATLSLGPAKEDGLPALHVTVIQGVPKGEKFEWVLQKATELGAGAFRPVHMKNGVVKIPAEKAESRTQRFSKIVEEAARQCGRSDTPGVFPPSALVPAVKAELEAGATVLVLDEAERAVRLADVFPTGVALPSRVAIVIGPEGGIARDEVEALTALGVRTVTLGPRVLRTETAAITAVALLQARSEGWG